MYYLIWLDFSMNNLWIIWKSRRDKMITYLNYFSSDYSFAESDFYTENVNVGRRWTSSKRFPDDLFCIDSCSKCEKNAFFQNEKTGTCCSRFSPTPSKLTSKENQTDIFVFDFRTVQDDFYTWTILRGIVFDSIEFFAEWYSGWSNSSRNDIIFTQILFLGVNQLVKPF